MPLTREQKIELLRKKQAGSLTREDKISLISYKQEKEKELSGLSDVDRKMKQLGLPTYEEMTAPSDIEETVKKLGIEPGTEAYAAFQGAKLGSQVPGTPITKALTGLAGAGLGYAGARSLTQNKPLGEKLTDIPQDILTGAAMEAGSQAIPVIASNALKAPGIIKTGVQKMMTREPIPIRGEIKTPIQAGQALKEVKLTPEMEARNLLYSEMGLDPLTPAQLQVKAGSEPTASQQAEALLKSADEGLYAKGKKQLETWQDLVKQYRERGAVTPEAAGQRIKEGIKTGKKAIGEEIGTFKEAGAETPIQIAETKPFDDFPLKESDVFSLGKDVKEIEGIKDLYNQAKTAKDLDNLSSQVGSRIKEAKLSGNDKLARKFTEVKTYLEDNLADVIEKAGIKKPKEAYQNFAKVKELEKDTLRNIYKTGKSKDVVNQITASGENINQFKKVAQALNKPELMDDVVDNWIADLASEVKINDVTGDMTLGSLMSKWEKVKRSGVAKELLSQDEFNKFENLINYYKQYSSTTSRFVNPPRSGFIESAKKLADNPQKFIVDLISGDARKYRRIARLYRQQVTSTPGLQKGLESRSPLGFMYPATEER